MAMRGRAWWWGVVVSLSWGGAGRAREPLDACLIEGVYFPEPKVRTFASAEVAFDALGIAPGRVRWVADQSVFVGRGAIGFVAPGGVRVVDDLDDAIPMDDPTFGISDRKVTSVSVGQRHVVVRMLDVVERDRPERSAGEEISPFDASELPTWTLVLLDRSTARILGAMRFSELGGSVGKPGGRIAIDNDSVVFEEELASARVALSTLERCALDVGDTRRRFAAHASAGRAALDEADRVRGDERRAALLRAEGHYRLANAISTRTATVAGWSVASAELTLEHGERAAGVDAAELRALEAAIEDAGDLDMGLRTRLYVAAVRVGLRCLADQGGSDRQDLRKRVRRWFEAAKRIGKLTDRAKLEAAIARAEAAP